MKVLYSDKINSDKLFNVIELRRYDFRRFAKKEKPAEFSELQKNLDILEEGIINQIKQIKEKHSETVQNYIFLDDIIKMWCPLFFHDVSAIDEKL
jgi:hypothetical protein